ncbi:hypothetical protein GHK24_02560 [Rhodocyclus tenuis]|uniref:Uncharacterized protein n=1 Tax=Rhodocyclus tenuis TaxID=1066 RepID=A0A6L5JUD0_RHOTE|nr:hypothetical protein [Rhodocyclus gracilis]
MPAHRRALGRRREATARTAHPPAPEARDTGRCGERTGDVARRLNALTPLQPLTRPNAPPVPFASFLRFGQHVRALLLLALAACVFGFPAQARDSFNERAFFAPPTSGIGTVAVADLPPEARETLRLIRRGGPFPFVRKDGSVFGNFEHRLPAQARGYYREFTVPTPGARDRGARRIIAGGEPQAAPGGEFYYSDDHYRTFRRIRE